MAGTATPTPFLVNVYNFFRGFSSVHVLNGEACLRGSWVLLYKQFDTVYVCFYKLENNMS